MRNASADVGISFARVSGRWASVAVVFVLGIGSVVYPASTASAVDQLIVSDEVADDPASSCQADNAGSPGPEIRTATDALDDSWHVAAASAGATQVQEALLPPAGSTPNPITITFPFASGNRTASVSAVDVADPALGSDDAGTPIVGSVSISTGATLQDCSPKPAHIYDADGPYWTENIGSGSNRNGVLFTFDTPVRAFGAWFGDVETRPEAEGGVTAVVKLFDADGAELVAAPITTSTPDTDVCGGVNSSDLPGCGNNTTRWIGFVRDNADVASMLVIVGDDDTAASGGDPGGLSEHISWTGAQLALVPASLAIDKTADVVEVGVGGSIEYTIQVTNTGDEPATAVVITDTPDPSLSLDVHDGGVEAGGDITWTIASLGGGLSATVTYSATVESFNQGGYMNTASAESATTSVIEDSVTVAAMYADLSIIKTVVNAPDAGDDLVYELTVANAGVSPATGVTVTETPDAPITSASGAGWTCTDGPPVTCVLAGSLPVGDASSTLVVTVATSADADTTVTNIASVSSDLSDPNEGDNADTVVVSVTTTTTLPPSTTTSSSTTSTSSTTSSTTMLTTTTSVPGDGGELPATGPTGPPIATGFILIVVGIVLVSGASAFGSAAAGRPRTPPQ